MLHPSPLRADAGKCAGGVRARARARSRVRDPAIQPIKPKPKKTMKPRKNKCPLVPPDRTERCPLKPARSPAHEAERRPVVVVRTERRSWMALAITGFGALLLRYFRTV